MSDTLDMEVLPSGAETKVMEQLARAEVDMLVSTARKFGRPDLSVIQSRIESIILRNEESAAGAFYTLKRKNNKDGTTKLIQGPSIRLLEAAMQQYQHLRVDCQVVHIDTTSDMPHVLMVGICHDMVNNVAMRVPTMRAIHSFVDRETGQRKVTPDAATLAFNSCTSFAMRNAGRRTMPASLINDIMEKAKKVAVGDAKSLEHRRGVVMERFAKLGVDQKTILLSLGKASVSDLDATDLENLIGLGAAIRDEQITIDEAFPVPGEQTTGEAPKVVTSETGQASTQPQPTKAKRATRKPATPAPEPDQGQTAPEAGAAAPAKPEQPADPVDDVPMGNTPPTEADDAQPESDMPANDAERACREINANIKHLSSAVMRLGLHKYPQFDNASTWVDFADIKPDGVTRIVRLWPTSLRNEVTKVIAQGVV